MVKYYCDICGKECSNRYFLSLAKEETDDLGQMYDDMNLCCQCCKNIHTYINNEIAKY